MIISSHSTLWTVLLGYTCIKLVVKAICCFHMFLLFKYLLLTDLLCTRYDWLKGFFYQKYLHFCGTKCFHHINNLWPQKCRYINSTAEINLMKTRVINNSLLFLTFVLKKCLCTHSSPFLLFIFSTVSALNS